MVPVSAKCVSTSCFCIVTSFAHIVVFDRLGQPITTFNRELPLGLCPQINLSGIKLSRSGMRRISSNSFWRKLDIIRGSFQYPEGNNMWNHCLEWKCLRGDYPVRRWSRQPLINVDQNSCSISDSPFQTLH